MFSVAARREPIHATNERSIYSSSQSNRPVAGFQPTHPCVVFRPYRNCVSILFATGPHPCLARPREAEKGDGAGSVSSVAARREPIHATDERSNYSSPQSNTSLWLVSSRRIPASSFGPIETAFRFSSRPDLTPASHGRDRRYRPCSVSFFFRLRLAFSALSFQQASDKGARSHVQAPAGRWPARSGTRPTPAPARPPR